MVGMPRAQGAPPAHRCYRPGHGRCAGVPRRWGQGPCAVAATGRMALPGGAGRIHAGCMWDDGGWGDGMWGMHGWGGWWGLLVMLGLLLVVVAGAVLLAVTLGRTGGGGQGPGGTPADRLLDERYARGEIDEQEYLHRRAVLRGR